MNRKNPKLVDQIVVTTNTQNKRTSRDLRSNDQVQQDMELLLVYNLYYERKPRQYDNAGVQLNRVIPNEFVGQSYMAIVLRRPSDARARKYKVWGDDYEKVFSGGIIEAHILSTQIATATKKYLNSSGLADSTDDIDRRIGKHGTFHAARIASYLWRRTENWIGRNCT